MKIKNRSRKLSHKLDGIGVRRIRTLPFLPTPLTSPSLTLCLRSSENQIVGVGSRSGRINELQCTFPRFVIGLVFLLLLPTLTIWFSLDHTRNVSDGVISGIGTLFSLDHKLITTPTPTPTPSLAKTNMRAFCMRMRQYGLLKCHRGIFCELFTFSTSIWRVLGATFHKRVLYGIEVFLPWK